MSFSGSRRSQQRGQARPPEADHRERALPALHGRRDRRRSPGKQSGHRHGRGSPPHRLCFLHDLPLLHLGGVETGYQVTNNEWSRICGFTKFDNIAGECQLNYNCLNLAKTYILI